MGILGGGAVSNPDDDVSAVSLSETVRGLEPIIREHAPVAERERRLPAAVAHAMRDQGLFRMWRPKAFGWYVTDPMTAVAGFQEASRICSAAGGNPQPCGGADAFS